MTLIGEEVAARVLDRALAHGGDLGEVYAEDRYGFAFGIDDSMRLWDVSTGDEVAVFETRVGDNFGRHRARLGEFSVDPVRLITSQQGSVVVRDPSNGLVEWSLSTAPISSSRRTRIRARRARETI